MNVDYPQVTIDCYVRAQAAGIFVNDVIDTVRSYEEAGLLSECAVEFWPNEIRLLDDTAGTDVRAQYREFQAWADSEGVSLEPAFTRRKRTTLVSDDAESVLVLPVLCLAIRVNGELVRVAPHATESGSYTVTDALADVESLPPSRDIAELPPDSPLRSALRTHAARNQPAVEPDDEPLVDQ